ncbi:HAD family hydrolase, partial [Streptomyces griseoincarnatus]
QMVLPVHELQSLASPRIVLRAPGVHALINPLRAVGLTATPADVDWVDVTGPNLSKASALETVRRRLGVPAERTVAVGDSVNDIEALTWAARGVAMGDAPDHVRAAADEVTGTRARRRHRAPIDGGRAVNLAVVGQQAQEAQRR